MYLCLESSQSRRIEPKTNSASSRFTDTRNQRVTSNWSKSPKKTVTEKFPDFVNGDVYHFGGHLVKNSRKEGNGQVLQRSL